MGDDEARAERLGVELLDVALAEEAPEELVEGAVRRQIRDLEATINAVDCDLVIIATPVDLTRIIRINKPMLKVGYELQEIGKPDLAELVRRRLGL